MASLADVPARWRSVETFSSAVFELVWLAVDKELAICCHGALPRAVSGESSARKGGTMMLIAATRWFKSSEVWCPPVWIRPLSGTTLAVHPARNSPTQPPECSAARFRPSSSFRARWSGMSAGHP